MLGDCKPTPVGVEYRFNCPECVKHEHTPDTGFHLYVNLQKGKYNCIRCGKPANSNGFFGNLKDLYGKEFKPPVDWERWESIRTRLLGNRVDSEEAGSIEQYLGWYTHEKMERHSDPDIYMRERTATIPPKEMATVWSKVFRQGKSKHFNRLFMLDWYKGKPRYCNARAIYDGVNPKYVNPPVPRYSLLFNQEKVEKRNPEIVIINEGILSAMHSGTNSVASYGRILTDAQLHILARLKCRRFYQTAETDPDGWRDAWKNAKELHGLGREVFLIPMPVDQDPAKMGRQAFLEYMETNSVVYSFKNRVYAALRKSSA